MTYMLWILFLVVGVALGWWFRSRRVPKLPGSTTTWLPQPLPTGYVPQVGSGAPANPRFKIWTVDGVMCYEDDDGVGARRCIEALRATGVEWESERDGESWDWGPR